MGDRVLFQVINSKTNEFGPVVYCHWSGSDAHDIVRNLAARMVGRGGDIDYATARLVQECIGDDGGNLGFGVWNTDAQLTEGDSHGDAGVVLIDCADGFKCQCMGGYLVLGNDEFPR
jgi:hypothetical protein